LRTLQPIANHAIFEVFNPFVFEAGSSTLHAGNAWFASAGVTTGIVMGKRFVFLIRLRVSHMLANAANRVKKVRWGGFNIRAYLFASMVSYTVTPRGKQWAVERSGVTISNHRKKDRAIDTAYDEATPGDRLTVRRSDGTIQDVRTIR